MSARGVGKADLIGVAVVVELALGRGASTGGLATASCSGKGVSFVGEGGNLKLDGGIFEACGIRPEDVRNCAGRGLGGTPAPAETCRVCDEPDVPGLPQGNPSGAEVAVAKGEGAGGGFGVPLP